jgi:hypothetical protein
MHQLMVGGDLDRFPCQGLGIWKLAGDKCKARSQLVACTAAVGPILAHLGLFVQRASCAREVVVNQKQARLLFQGSAT